MKTLFTRHPNSIGESFIKHFIVALSVGCRMVFAGLACIIHAFLPFLFDSTASNTVQKIHGEFKERFSVLENKAPE